MCLVVFLWCLLVTQLFCTNKLLYCQKSLSNDYVNNLFACSCLLGTSQNFTLLHLNLSFFDGVTWPRLLVFCQTMPQTGSRVQNTCIEPTQNKWVQKALVYFSEYKLRKTSDKISGRRPNQNIDGNTYYKLIIFKRIFDEKK